MLRDHLLQLLKEYPPDVQQVIIQVVRLEREYISLARPRVRDQVQDIIRTVADKYPPDDQEEADEA